MLILITNVSLNAQDLKAFPSAYGAGSVVTTGARNDGSVAPVVLHVTRLDDDTNTNTYQGTFRWAMYQEYPRIIVFDVSGTITLNGRIMMGKTTNRDNVTVLGQTAPEGGITIAGSYFQWEETHNAIIRYIRFRGGDAGSSTKALRWIKSHYGIFDHCEFFYGTDESAAFGGNSNNEFGGITIQNCLFADAATGTIAGISNEVNDVLIFGGVSYLRNAYVNISHRFPKSGGVAHFDVINNVVHNWKWRLMRFDAHNYTLNEINNYYQDGINSQNFGNANNGLHKMYTNNTISPQIYTNGNYIREGHLSELGITGYDADNSLGWSKYNSSTVEPKSEWFINSPLPFEGAEPIILSAIDAKQHILENVGTRHYLNADGTVGEYLDNLDIRQLGYIENNNQVVGRLDPSNYGEQATSPESNTRPSNYYLNSPHIPEPWFSANVPNGQTALNTAPSGYLWIEEFANQVDGPSVSIALEGITVAPATDTIEVNETIELAVTFNPTNATNQSGVWTSADTGIATVDENGIVTGITPGIVFITFTSNDVGGLQASAEITVFVEALVASAGEDQEICDGETISLTASGGTNYLWSTGDTTAVIDVNPTETTTYSVVVSNDLGEEDTDDVIVTVISAPVADAGVDQTICDGETITLTATGGISYLWNTGETTDSIDVSPTSETIYNVDVTSNTCSSTDSVTVFVVSAPNLTVSNDIVIADGDSTTLVANGSDNYSWSTGETTASISVSPTVTTTYTVSSIGANNCAISTDVTVTVIPEVIADAGTDSTICVGESVILNATGGGTYLWNTGETTSELIVSPLVTTIYTVTVEDGFGFTDSDSVTITVNETPDITVTNNVVIVDGESTTLVANGSDNYAWSTGETTASIIVSPIVTTTYTVSSFGGGSCEDTEQVTVTVIPEVIADAGTDITICRDESVTLNATGGGTYIWDTGDTTSQLIVTPLVTTTYTVTVEDDYGYTDTDSVTITVNETPDIIVSADIVILDGESTTLVATGGDNYQWNTGETTSTILVTPLITTTYTVISTAVGGCADIEQVTVTVIPEVIADAGQDATICSGEIITLNASGGSIYLWNTGETTPNLTISPLLTTTYTVTVEDDYGYTDTDSVTITVNETPDISVSDAITIMDGESTTLSASGGDNYQWSTGETTASIIVSPTITTIYTVSSLGASDCEDTEEVTVTVIPELIANAGADAVICNGDSITLNASGGITYTWNTGDTGSQLTVSPTVTTTYSVTVEDGFGNSDTDSVTITVHETPNISVSDAITIMDGESTTLSANGGDNYQWSTGETTASIVVNPSITTTYTVSSIGVGDCEDTEEVTVTVIPELIANAGADTGICSGDSITLNASGGITYTWNTGETGSQLTVSPNVTTTYTVTVEDGLGNSDNDSVTVVVNEIPNVTVSQNITIVEGQSTDLVVSGAQTYQWNTGETSNSITVSPSQTTTYTVIATANTCSIQAQVTVTIEGVFEASAGEDERILTKSF